MGSADSELARKVAKRTLLIGLGFVGFLITGMSHNGLHSAACTFGGVIRTWPTRRCQKLCQTCKLFRIRSHSQIARIACTTVACPAGLFNVGEEGEVEKSEEFTPLPAREMASAASWCHRYV